VVADYLPNAAFGKPLIAVPSHHKLLEAQGYEELMSESASERQINLKSRISG
jgi:hypothetical protein